MQTYGLGWYMVQLAAADGRPQLAPLYLGLVAATRAVPSLLIGPVAGAISDQMDRRKLLMLSSSTAAIVAVVFALAVMAGQATLAVVLVLSTLGAMAQTFEPVTRMAMVPRLVPPHTISSAVGLILSTSTLAMLLGPLAGGLLIGPIGVGGLLAVNAITFVPVIVAMLAMRPMPLGSRPRSSLLRSLGDGFVYVWRDPVLRPIFVLTGVLAIAARPYQQLLPAFATDALKVGAVELSWLYAAAGAGSVFGSTATASVGAAARRGRTLAASGVLFAAMVVVFALQRDLGPALVAVAAASLAAQVQIGLHIATYQAAAPEHVRGRVTAVSATLVTSASALGALLFGVLGSLVGIDLALVLGGVAALVFVASLLRSAALRVVDAQLAPVAIRESSH